MEIKIVDYESNDFIQLLKILESVYESNINQEDLERYYLGDNKKIYLAKIEDTIVGCSFLEIKNDYIRPYKYGYITYVAVDDKCRKIGIGSKLLDHVLVSAKKLGCSTVELTSANSRTGAHAFYESLGFTKKKTTVFIKDPL